MDPPTIPQTAQTNPSWLPSQRRMLLRTTILCAIICLIGINANSDGAYVNPWPPLEWFLTFSAFPLLVLGGQLVKLVLVHLDMWKATFELSWSAIEIAFFVYIVLSRHLFKDMRFWMDNFPVWVVSFFAVFFFSVLSFLLAILDLVNVHGQWRCYSQNGF
ncbi:hypothetical protein NP233_g6883 [Leucocoprinus birnbaumii]|uniref:Uncharacterized protein n=1 Tax=Leucocoprinus birnbaumii TaxID=56174 RepID=A0AAD5YPL9_9AGAR|nr:hypothetical protein NP233_g6883 [Leucocoprinus birnbaumii]